MSTTFEIAKQQHLSGNPATALPVYQQVLKDDPNNAEALFLMGVACLQTGRHEPAVAYLAKAAQLAPESPDIRHHFANALLAVDKAEAALPHYIAALRKAPTNTDMALNMGLALQKLGRLEEELGLYENIYPHQKNSGPLLNELVKLCKLACKWERLEEYTARLCTHAEADPCPISPYHSLSLPLSPESRLDIARRHAGRIVEQVKEARETLNFTRDTTPKSTLTIGYLCADFRDHPTAHLIKRLFALHDRQKVKVFAYALADEPEDPYRQQLAKDADHFFSLQGLNTVEAARRIHNDKVDILVDMMGYLQNARPQILALRPAPVQLHFLAYPGSMGAEFVDYLITDHTALPKDAEDTIEEAPVYMPGSYFITDNTAEIGAATTRKEHGLPEEAFVFCCFNKSDKLTPEVFAEWMDILRAVPNAVLWLYAPYEVTRKHLQQEIERQNIAKERVIFAERLPKAQHLARLKLADLFLDTTPICAHTTAIDALWAGVPVLARQGDSIISNASASILRAAGLDNALLCKDAASYKQKAIAFAQAPQTLKPLKEKLANPKALPLFDTEKYVRTLEQAHHALWQRHTAGEEPQAIDAL